MSLEERRHDHLTRSEFSAAMGEMRVDIKEILAYGREQNSKQAKAFERLATLEERTQNIKDGPGRLISYSSLALSFILFIVTLMKNGVAR